MSHLVKASTVAFLKKHFRELTNSASQKFIQSLTPHLQELYQTALASTWITDEDENQLIDAAIPILFPEEKDAYYALGRMIAQSNLSGPYRIFLKIPSRVYVFKRAANLWRTLNQAGHAMICDETSNSVTFKVEDFPNMRFYHKQFTAAYVYTVLEATGARNAHVEIIDVDPQNLLWVGRWI